MKIAPEDRANLVARAVIGFFIGAFCGAVVGVVGAAVYFFGVYPMFHKVNWDNPGIMAASLFAAPFGAIIGAALEAAFAVRRR
jgi:uncharacterized membrane protein YeaQ/YmgE (transglycosylase-associated protein family)